MQLKTFSAPSAAQVIAQIKAELGSDAVILDTREQDGEVTMTAALDRQHLPKKENGEFPSFAPADTAAAIGMPHGWQQWHEEWGTIKDHILSLMKPALKLEELAPRQRLALEFLQREGVDDEALLTLFRHLRAETSASILGPLGQIVHAIPWNEVNWPETIHMVSGPFGAGKTSVTIRLALALRKQSPDLRICMINADATRGSGRLLLRHYSELSEMAYLEAASTMELVAQVALAEKKRYDRIFIDLPGLSRGKFLQTLLADAGLHEQSSRKIAVHLTFPPHYGNDQLRSLLARYHTQHRGSMIWTKLDEADHFGHIVNVALATRLPISALSYGPGLGNSLLPAQEAMIWKLLFKKELTSA